MSSPSVSLPFIGLEASNPAGGTPGRGGFGIPGGGKGGLGAPASNFIPSILSKSTVPLGGVVGFTLVGMTLGAAGGIPGKPIPGAPKAGGMEGAAGFGAIGGAPIGGVGGLGAVGMPGMGIGGFGAVGIPGMGIGGFGAPTRGEDGIEGPVPDPIPDVPEAEGTGGSAGFFSIKESKKLEVDEGGFNPGTVGRLRPPPVGLGGAGEGGKGGFTPIPGELGEPAAGLGTADGTPGAVGGEGMAPGTKGGGLRPGAVTGGTLDMRESSNPGVVGFIPGTPGEGGIGPNGFGGGSKWGNSRFGKAHSGHGSRWNRGR